MKLRNHHASGSPQKRQRSKLARVTVKEVVCKILGAARAALIFDLADLKGQALCIPSDPGRRGEKMIVALKDSMIQEEPVERAKAVEPALKPS